MSNWLDPQEWYRDGRGRGWSFVLSTDDLADVLQEVAAERDQLTLLACWKEQVEHRRWNSMFREMPLTSLSLDDDVVYYIRSVRNTPWLPVAELRAAPGWDAVFSTSGLIHLWHPDRIWAARFGQTSKDSVPPSEIGIVHRVRHAHTGRVHEHRGYDAIFGEIKRAIRRRLRAEQRRC
jgi:hypothetical protein